MKTETTATTPTPDPRPVEEQLVYVPEHTATVEKREGKRERVNGWEI